MNELLKATVSARLMMARAYANEGWHELAAVQLKLIRKEIAAYKANATAIIRIAA
jgi:hypothetical protein